MFRIEAFSCPRREPRPWAGGKDITHHHPRHPDSLQAWTKGALPPGVPCPVGEPATEAGEELCLLPRDHCLWPGEDATPLGFHSHQGNIDEQPPRPLPPWEPGIGGAQVPSPVPCIMGRTANASQHSGLSNLPVRKNTGKCQDQGAACNLRLAA